MKREEILSTFAQLITTISRSIEPVIENTQELQDILTKLFPPLSEIPLAQQIATEKASQVLNSFLKQPNDYPGQYKLFRSKLVADSVARRLIPFYIRDNEELIDCLQAIPFQNPGDKLRFLRDFTIPQFIRQIDRLSQFPSDLQVARTFAGKEMDEQFQQWLKALERREHDPSGAITVAKTMLESVCKKILRDANENFKPNEKLPKLYNQVADKLNLTPSQDQNEGFRQFTGGAASVVNGLCSVRNKMGDAHDLAFKPEQHHAELAVNLAGSLAMFLVEVSVVAR